MSAQFSLSEPVLTAKCDLQHTFANPCLKRKLETEVKNGFVAVQHHEMSSAEQEYNFISEKRPRFSNCFPHDELGIEINRNQGLRNGELNYFPTVVDNCSNTAQHGNNIGADSLLQNNSEWETSCENEEATGMDVECETDGESCPPNSNIGSTTVVPSDPCSSNESTPVKGSPAREFLSKYRPEYQMYCIPSYCHPGGLWDVMLEVYHGL